MNTPTPQEVPAHPKCKREGCEQEEATFFDGYCSIYCRDTDPDERMIRRIYQIAKPMEGESHESLEGALRVRIREMIESEYSKEWLEKEVPNV
jgi:hypothetical protein